MAENSPLSQSQRTPLIDILRGWALFSVVIMNYATIYDWNHHADKTKQDNLTSCIEAVLEVILGSKGWTLLAVLFGFGFSVLLRNTSQRGQPVYTFFIIRMLWLFVFAFVNTLFFGGDILNDYAFMGLVLLLFYRLNPKSLVFLSISILIFTPILQSYLGTHHLLFTPKDRDTFFYLYSQHDLISHLKANLFMRYKWMLRLSYVVILHLIQLGCFLAGLALERNNFLLRINSKSNVLKIIFVLSFIFSLLTFLTQFFIEKYDWRFNQYYNLYYPERLCAMIFTSTCIVWLYLSGVASKLFSGLQAIGKVTLTSYIIQNMIAFILFICLKPEWALSWYLLTAIIIYFIQIFFSIWWLSRFNYGILEWLWRYLSYGRVASLGK